MLTATGKLDRFFAWFAICMHKCSQIGWIGRQTHVNKISTGNSDGNSGYYGYTSDWFGHECEIIQMVLHYLFHFVCLPFRWGWTGRCSDIACLADHLISSQRKVRYKQMRCMKQLVAWLVFPTMAWDYVTFSTLEHWDAIEIFKE